MVQPKGDEGSIDRGRLYFPPVETIEIASRSVEQTYRVKVVQPPQGRDDTRRFPAIFMVDGNQAFDLCKSLSWLMQQGEVPPYILVSVEYPAESPVGGELLRMRDLTFPDYPNYLEGHPELLRWGDVLRPPNGGKTFGGGEAFLHFLGTELIPRIEERYRVLSDFRIYFGHSLAGGFGLVTLLSAPRLFRGYICSSPTVAYHGRTPQGLVYERDFLSERLKAGLTALSSSPESRRRLFLSVGTCEEFEPAVENWHFVSNFFRLTSFLKHNPLPGLTVRSRVFEGETHLTVWPRAFMEGVRTMLLGPWDSPEAL